MKKRYIIIISLTLIIIYLILINFVGAFIQSYSTEIITQENKTESGAVQEFNFGSSVQVSVTRPRFYGTIFEQNKNSNLYLFNIIPLPLKSNNISLIKFHLIFVVLLLIFVLLSIFIHKLIVYC
jgi:hypothetical protein